MRFAFLNCPDAGSRQVKGIFTVVTGTALVANQIYKVGFTLTNSPFGQYAPSISISAGATILMKAQYVGQQLYPTYDQWGNPIPPITPMAYGTIVAVQKAITGMGYKAPMLICGFLPAFSGYAAPLPYLFQSTPSSNATNTFNLTFALFCEIANASVMTLSGMSAVQQPDGPVALKCTITNCSESNTSEACSVYSEPSIFSSQNGTLGAASWQGSSDTLTFYVPEPIPPNMLVSVTFSLINPRFFTMVSFVRFGRSGGLRCMLQDGPASPPNFV